MDLYPSPPELFPDVPWKNDIGSAIVRDFMNKGFILIQFLFRDVPTADFVGRGFARLTSLAGSTHTLCPLSRGSLL